MLPLQSGTSIVTRSASTACLSARRIGDTIKRPFVAGAIKSFTPWTLALSYAHITGAYAGVTDARQYTDRTNIFNFKALQTMGTALTGVSYSLIDLNGFKSPHRS